MPDSPPPSRSRRPAPAGGGPQRATVQDVAEAAGVSTATVSRVLNGNYPVAAETRRKVERAVRSLGYVVNAHARALAGSFTRTVGIIVADVVDPFFAHIAHGVTRQAAEDGKLCLVCSTYGVLGGELDLIDVLNEQRAEAVVVVGGGAYDPVYSRRLAERAKALNRAGSWLILCGRPPLAAGVPTGVIDYDNAGGAFAVTEYLLGLGHRRILYLGGPEELSTHHLRLEGFRKAHAARGLPVDERLIQRGAFSRRFGYERTAQLLESGEAGGFTAVFGGNDNVAVGVLQAAREAGLQVPRDLSVVGYDDIPLASEVLPALTTVHLPLEQMGREAVRLAAVLRGEAEGSKDTRHLGTHLVIRDSTGAPSAPVG
ncbi:LacI family DNA-binding transcriptional regulator [Catenulispora subtropica]|uniref:LacI family DNA-binding transcriptional regulator n=1 Tax=Catenulispora subtropica TaxID=450798 RepID=A0ABN2ST83_9ACTN